MADEQAAEELTETEVEADYQAQASRRESVTERSARRKAAKAKAAITMAANAKQAEKDKAKARKAGTSSNDELAKLAKRHEDASTARAKAKAEAK